MVGALGAYFKEIQYPDSAEEVKDIVSRAARDGNNIVPLGNGTKIGDYLGEKLPNTIGLSLKKMAGIIEVNPANLTVTVEPGILLLELNRVLQQHNLCLPIVSLDGQSRTIGGLIAENAGNYEKYANKNIGDYIIGDYIIGLEFVTPEGDLIRTGGRTVKNVAGYNFTHLLNGSLGTLAVITQVIFKLKPKPELRKTILLAFDDLAAGNDLMNIVKKMSLAATAFEMFTASDCFDPAFFAKKGVKAIGAISLAGARSTVEDHIEKIKAAVQRSGVAEKVLDSTDYWQAYALQYRNIPRKYKICGNVDKRHLQDFADQVCENKEIFDGLFIDAGTGEIALYCKDQAGFKTAQDKMEKFTSRRGLASLIDRKPPHPLYRLIKNSLDKKNCLFPNNLVLAGDYSADKR